MLPEGGGLSEGCRAESRVIKGLQGKGAGAPSHEPPLPVSEVCGPQTQPVGHPHPNPTGTTVLEKSHSHVGGPRFPGPAVPQAVPQGQIFAESLAPSVIRVETDDLRVRLPGTPLYRQGPERLSSLHSTQDWGLPGSGLAPSTPPQTSFQIQDRCVTSPCSNGHGHGLVHTSHSQPPLPLHTSRPHASQLQGSGQARRAQKAGAQSLVC